MLVYNVLNATELNLLKWFKILVYVFYCNKNTAYKFLQCIGNWNLTSALYFYLLNLATLHPSGARRMAGVCPEGGGAAEEQLLLETDMVRSGGNGGEMAWLLPSSHSPMTPGSSLQPQLLEAWGQRSHGNAGAEKWSKSKHAVILNDPGWPDMPGPMSPIVFYPRAEMKPPGLIRSSLWSPCFYWGGRNFTLPSEVLSAGLINTLT